MELDDMKIAWQGLDRRVTAVQALNARIVNDITRTKTRSALLPFEWLLWTELATSVVLAILTGAFLGEHWRTARFAVPGVVLHVAAILIITRTIAVLHAVRAIDYAAPVVAIQRALTNVATLRIRTGRWLMLAGPLMWTPLAIVCAQALLRFDLYTHFGTGWIVANVAVTIVVVPLMYWLAQRFSARADRAGLMQSLADDVAGRSLRAANGVLEEIRRFESENAADGRP